MQILKMG